MQPRHRERNTQTHIQIYKNMYTQYTEASGVYMPIYICTKTYEHGQLKREE